MAGSGDLCMPFRIAFPLCVLAALTGCITAPFNESMSALMYAEPGRSLPLEYRGGSNCVYRSEIRSNGESQVILWSVAVRQIGDRIQIAMKDQRSGSQTSILLQENGRVTDFNSVDPTTGRQISSDDQALINVLIDRGQMLEFRYLFPEFLSGDRNVGEEAAIVRLDDGSVWGRYVHRGFVWRGGKATQVMELQLPNDSGQLSRAGFGFFSGNGMPVEVMLGRERNFRLQSCS